MIQASDALALPTARLSEEQMLVASQVLAEIFAHARTAMGFRGFDFRVTSTTDGNVIAYCNQRMRRAGWLTSWQPLVEKNPNNPREHTIVGWGLNAQPTDESYRIAMEEAPWNN